MRIFVSGGSKNGKSMWAQRRAKAQRVSGAPLYYVATMRPVDGEDEARIARHRAEREGWGFETLELAADIGRLAKLCDPEGSVLLDSVTALLMNELYTPDGREDAEAPARVAAGLTTAIAALPNIVVVSDFLYSDAELYDPGTERYRKALACLDRACAAACEGVVEFVSGFPLWHKGEPIG